MDPDDENYGRMLEERKSYMEMVFEEAKQNDVEITPWEEEEIEMAFEHAFCKGFIAASHKRRQEELN